MPWFSADLHLHSCLSPCGSLESSPAVIATIAKERGLDLIALTDHNSSLNCPAFAENCRRAGISPLFGMEATSSEEAHCLCLFSSLETALAFGKLIAERLIPVPNDPEQWGDQIVVNADEEIEAEESNLLINATTVSVEELCNLVHEYGGLFIPAHVDRNAFSLMSQLGFVPPGNYDALEIYRETTNLRTVRLKPQIIVAGSPEWQKCQLPPEAGHTNRTDILLPSLICNSDAHYPEDIGKRRFHFWSDRTQADIEGLKIALRNAWIQRQFDY